MPDASLVTMHLWGVPGRSAPRAVWRMATDRGPIRRTPGLQFAKLLGTGTGRTFGPRDADPTRWGLLAVWDSAEAADRFEDGRVAAGWRRLADEVWSARLRPLVARGLWSGREPFGRPIQTRWDGPVAAVTRARLDLRRSPRFWGAVPPVSAALHGSPGLRLAVGIGEAPIGLQGTFSLWESSRALSAFAYGSAAHTAVVRRTPEERWYVEELFARLAVLSTTGTVDGRNPMALG